MIRVIRVIRVRVVAGLHSGRLQVPAQGAGAYGEAAAVVGTLAHYGCVRVCVVLLCVCAS